MASTAAPRIVVYQGKHRLQAFQHDAAHLAQQGYFPITQSDISEKPGCLKLILWGYIFARPTYKLTVTYEYRAVPPTR